MFKLGPTSCLVFFSETRARCARPEPTLTPPRGPRGARFLAPGETSKVKKRSDRSQADRAGRSAPRAVGQAAAPGGSIREGDIMSDVMSLRAAEDHGPPVAIAGAARESLTPSRSKSSRSRGPPG